MLVKARSPKQPLIVITKLETISYFFDQSQAGIYWEELLSYYSGGWSLVLIGWAEACVWAWIYGTDLSTPIFIDLSTKIYDNYFVMFYLIKYFYCVQVVRG